MASLGRATTQILKHPADFALRTLKGFSKNQGILLAGAIAYYALLSVLPLLILLVIALSRLVDQAEILDTLRHYLDWLVPSQSKTVLADVSSFLENGIAIGAVLLLTMIFFSSLAFSVLEKAMAIIFGHRGAIVKRHALVSAVLPYCFVLFLCIAMLGLTMISVGLQTMAQEHVILLGKDWSLNGISGVLLYLLGFTTETFILAALYLVLPVGRMPVRHALIGGVTATSIWEVVRHILIWYFTTLSTASVVYGSLTTAVIALFSMEIAATVFLLGAQVISEYERLELE